VYYRFVEPVAVGTFCTLNVFCCNISFSVYFQDIFSNVKTRFFYNHLPFCENRFFTGCRNVIITKSTIINLAQLEVLYKFDN